jgi:predicted alpha/beta-hydrolase family hydrolase
LHLLDLLFGMAARGPRFFADGWGDRVLCEAIAPEAIFGRPVPAIRVQLGEMKRAFGGLLLDGSFDSPEERLPACARTARIRVLLPEGEPRGVAVHLAASGDQGFAVRLRFAAPLLERGIGAVVLENAYYGARRPENQIGPAIRSVADLHLMGSATFQEGRALLRWLQEGLEIPLVGVTGYSMGGQMAAMVGAAAPFPCAVVPIAPTCSPDSVLQNGFIRHVAHWAALMREGEDAEAARRGLCALLARFSVTALPPPRCPEAAIVVGTSQDGVVPPSEMNRIAEHWGAELRWLDAGHVSAVLRHQGDMRRALLDAFDRLEAALRRVPPSGPSRRRARGSAPRAPGAPASAGVRARWRGPAAARRT